MFDVPSLEELPEDLRARVEEVAEANTGAQQGRA